MADMLKQLFARPSRRKRKRQNFEAEPEAIPLIDDFSHNIHQTRKRPKLTSPNRQQRRHWQIMHFTTVIAVTMTAVGLMAPAVAAPVPDSAINIYFGGPDDITQCGGHLPIACPGVVEGGDSSIGNSKREQDSIIAEPFDEAVEAIVQRQQDNGLNDGYCGGPMRPCGPADSYKVPEAGPLVGWNVKVRDAEDETSIKPPRKVSSGIHLDHLPVFRPVDFGGEHGGAPFKREEADTDPEDCTLSACKGGEWA